MVSAPGGLLISGGSVIVGDGTARSGPTDVYLEGDLIVAVGDDARSLADAAGPAVEQLDATGLTVMPGLIDAHCHITFGEPASNDELFFHRDRSTAALVAAFDVQKLLLAGVTGFLDADCLWNLGPALRDAIQAGIVDGPRMTAGMNALLTAAGGTAGRLIPDSGTAAYAHVVGDRDEMVRTTRQQIKHGADWVKIHVTGSLPNRSGELTMWTLDELRAVVDTAHDLGTPCIAHCRNATSTRLAAEAGVDLILHASFLDEAALAAVVEADCAVAPTFTFLANLADHGDKVGAATPRSTCSAARSRRRPPCCGPHTTPACGSSAAPRAGSPSRPTATGTPARWRSWWRPWGSARSRRSGAPPTTAPWRCACRRARSGSSRRAPRLTCSSWTVTRRST